MTPGKTEGQLGWVPPEDSPQGRLAGEEEQKAQESCGGWRSHGRFSKMGGGNRSEMRTWGLSFSPVMVVAAVVVVVTVDTWGA